MKRFSRHCLGAAQGSVILFSDFLDDGPMWAGSGPREKRRSVTFSEPFAAVPMIQVAISLWDMDSDTNQRADLRADAITAQGFDLVFRTWGDSRIARIRADWMALGDIAGDDDWTLY